MSHVLFNLNWNEYCIYLYYIYMYIYILGGRNHLGELLVKLLVVVKLLVKLLVENY